MTKVEVPEVRINFSWLLTRDVSEQLASLKGLELESYDYYREKTTEYRKEWSKRGDTILAQMQSVTGLRFYLPVIDVVTAPLIIPKSFPLLISFRNSKEDIVELITHELSHTLICDNHVYSTQNHKKGVDLSYEFTKAFGNFDGDTTALNHVGVHAICYKIFVDIFKDKAFLSREKESLVNRNATSYLKSWDYVESVGSDEILEKIKNIYAKIAKKLEKES